MPDMSKYSKYYKQGTASSTDKMLDKFTAKADEAVNKLKSQDVKDAWHTNVSKQETKQRFSKAVDNLSASDLSTPMKEKGIEAYRRATSGDTAAKKWETNAAPYVEIAQEVSKNKKPVTSIDDALANVRTLMEKMQNKKKEIG